MRAYARRRTCVKTVERWEVRLYWNGKAHARTWFEPGVALSSRELAEHIAHEINADIRKARGGFRPDRWFRRDDSMQFGNYWRSWLALKLKRGEIIQVTHDRYKTILEGITGWSGMDINEIRRSHIEDVLDGAKDRHTTHAILSGLFRAAQRREDIEKVPGMPQARAGKPHKEGPSREVQRLVMAHLPDHDRPAIEFCCEYGLRVSELIALQWDCIMWKERKIIIRRTVTGHGQRATIKESRKGGDRLPLPFTDRAEAILRDNRAFSGYVFRNSHGERYRRQYLDRILRAACIKAGVSPMGMHLFARHGLGGWLMNVKKVGREITAAILGHTTTQHTGRYSTVTNEGIQGVLE